MKKLSMICMAALLLLAASCKKDEKTEQYSGEGFRATAEAQQSNSKTHLDADLNVDWDEGDAILAFSDGCPEGYKFVAKQGGEIETEFIAEGGNPEGFFAEGYTYTAFYPYANVSGTDVCTLTLPAEQDAVYEDDAFQCAFANGANPMAAISTERVLEFKNICGILELQLYSATACNVNNITLTTKGEESLYGAGEVTFNGGEPKLGDLENGGKTLTLNCNDKPLSQSLETPSYFCFVLPVGTLANGFEVTLTDKDGKTWTKSTSESDNAIVRSQICEMPALEVTFSSDVPEDFVDFGTHVGGIGGTRPLYWAECNLGANNPQDYGDYYVWGNTSKYEMNGSGYGYEISYYNGTYVFGMYDGGACDLTKYNDCDHRTELEPEDDCVWQANKTYNEANPTEVIRMPSLAEFDELFTKAYFEWTTGYKDTGVAGVIIYAVKDSSHAGQFGTQTGSYSTTSDKHIFIPAAGFGNTSDNYISGQTQILNVWLKTIANYETGKPYGLSIYITSSGIADHSAYGGYSHNFVNTRIRPCSIRPVREGNN